MKAIAACSANKVIGANNGLPWKSKEDLAFFKEKTLNHTLVMGNKTYHSLPRLLPNRDIIVLASSHNAEPELVFKEANCKVRFINNLEDVLAYVHNIESAGGECWVAGGANVYNQLFTFCQEVFLTEFEFEVKGDTYLPHFEHMFDKREIVRKITNGTIYRYFKV